MIKGITQREKIIFCLTIGIILFSACFNLLIAPVLKKYENLNREISLSRARLIKYLQVLSQKERIQSRITNLSSTINVSGQRKDAVVLALSELEALAKKADIRIIDIRPQASAKEITIDLRAEGAIDGYFKFIYDLEHSPQLFSIKRFQLNAKPNSSSLEGNFSISQLSLD